MMQATGPFEVKLTPMDGFTPEVGRMSIEKTFHGGLEATSRGEMISVLDRSLGSGAYVALERVTGVLGGKSGSFSLVHRGLMNRGAPSLTVEVVPDSGGGDLAGLTGAMTIVIDAGKHSYVFDYALP